MAVQSFYFAAEEFMTLSSTDAAKKAVLPLLLVFLLLVCAAAAPAQSAPQTAPQPTPRQTTSSTEASSAEPEHHISPEEAKELLNSVDAVLKFDSQNTGLPIRHEVKRSLAGRKQVEDYIQSRLRNDEDAERLRSAESVLKKFGLFPRDFDLEKFLVQLMGEQVAGYYDTDTKTVYLLNWLPPETQQPVLAHELVHALQDQNFGIEKWVRKADSHKQSAEKQVASDEATAARHAIIEGQAMAVMVDFLLAPIHGSLVNSPVTAQAIEQGMLQSSDSPVMGRSPLYLRQLLMFPYSYGLNFIRELLVYKGKEGAYAEVFEHPPGNTRQIMQPETYLANEKLPDIHLPKFESLLGPEYQFFDVGSIGEFDVSVMVQQFGNTAGNNRPVATAPARPNIAQRNQPEDGSHPAAQEADERTPPLWTHWRGGFYYAARRKKTSQLAQGAEVPAADISLVFVSQWDTPDAAADFARIYRASIPKRYTGISMVPAHTDCANCQDSAASDNATSFETDEGPVSVQVHKDVVVAIESFPPEIAAKIRSAVLKAQ
jgi:hypothetical protein